jgi:hypothetical protein
VEAELRGEWGDEGDGGENEASCACGRQHRTPLRPNPAWGAIGQRNAGGTADRHGRGPAREFRGRNPHGAVRRLGSGAKKLVTGRDFRHSTW